MICLFSSSISNTIFRVFLGQFLAMCMSVTGLFTTLLVEDNSSLPLLQSITAYCLISILFSGIYFHYVIRNKEWINHQYMQVDSSSLDKTEATFGQRVVTYFRSSLTGGYKGVGKSIWRFAAIALIDLEANFAVVFAYRYTDITSVQLLDCSSIIWVMILSVVFLGARYQLRWHLVGAVIAVVGIVLLIVFDTTNMNRETSENNTHQNSTINAASKIDGVGNSSQCRDTSVGDKGNNNILLGDMLCLISSLLYALSNVACERLVKKSLDTNEETDEGATSNTYVTTPLHDGTTGKRIQYGAIEKEISNTAVEVETENCCRPKVEKNTVLIETNAPSLQWIVIIEYLFWMPLFGAVFGSIQFLATQEYKLLPMYYDGTSSDGISNCSSTDTSGSIADSAFYRVYNGDSYVDIFYQLSFGISMLVIYTLMPVLFCVASATFANLSLLTSDIFSIFWNVTVFKIYPKPTFFISFVLILLGVMIFDTNGLESLWNKKKSEDEEASSDNNSNPTLKMAPNTRPS